MMAASFPKTNDIDYFTGHVSFSLGEEDNILFWYGRWLREYPFKGLFPLLFNLSSKLTGFVKDMGVRNGLGWSWDFHVEADILLDILLGAINRF